MKLKRLRLVQVRRFREALEIAEFAPGLNLFTGPNEAGKSTIVRAIRAVFFERHRSRSIDDLIPRGETVATASPTIELQFEAGGIEHRLAKTFFSKKRCDYQAGPRAFDGEAAEEALSALLGFGYPGKGASKPEHWGIPGLLWVQQGDGHQIHEPVRSASEFLRKALDSTVSAVASTGGDEVLASLRAQRDELLTPGGGRPRAGYADVIRDLAEARVRLTVLDSQIADYRADVDRLDTLRRQHALEGKASPWVVFGQKLARAQAELEAARQLTSELARQDGEARTVERTITALDQQLQGLAAERAELGRRQAELAVATQAAEAAATALGLCEQQRGRAQGAREAAGRRLVLAEREATRRGLLEALERATVDETRITRTLAQAEQHAATLARYKAEIEANRIDEAALKKLSASVETLREREIQLRAAATVIHLELLPGQTARLDGQPVAPVGEHRVTARSRIEIDGVGAIEVTPGDGDGVELERQVTAARADRDAILARIGAASVDEALARKSRFDRAVIDARGAGDLLAAHAPKGIEPLRADLIRAQQTRDDARRQLDALVAADGGSPVVAASPVDVASPLDAASPIDIASPAIPGLDEARATLTTAIDEQARVADEHSKAAIAAAAALAAREGLARVLAELQARLDDPASREREQEARLRLAQAQADQDQARTAMAALRARIEASQPEALAQDVTRLEQSRDQARASFDQRVSDISALQGRLEMAGTRGLEDERAETVVREASLARRHGELELRAKALELLVSRMEAKRQALTARLQAPLQRRLDHYLRLLFPGARLALNEDLTPGDLERGAGTVDFSQLSHGAQEQTALISRLAYADLLKEAGKPTLIVLDDALVHSDAARIEQMQRVLFDAATRHQILVFSCHPDRWAGLGVAARDVLAFQLLKGAP